MSSAASPFAKGSLFAVLYNDPHRLENPHHAASSWTGLSKRENDFLVSTLTSEDRHQFRSVFISAILHTAMSLRMKGVLGFDASVPDQRSHSV
jgi:hypothetical protein